MTPHASSKPPYTATGVMNGSRPKMATAKNARSTVLRSHSVPTTPKTISETTRTAAVDSAFTRSSNTPADASGSVQRNAAPGAFHASTPASPSQTGSVRLQTTMG